MRVDADRRVDVRLRRASATAASEVGTSVPIVRKAATPDRAGAREDGRTVVVERREVQVRVRVEQPAHAPPGSAGGRSAGRTRSPRPPSTAHGRRGEVRLPRERPEPARRPPWTGEREVHG